MYAQDYDETACPSYFTGGNVAWDFAKVGTVYVPGLLGAYTKDGRIAGCPDWVNKNPALRPVNGYAYNATYLGGDMNTPAFGDIPPAPLSRIARPADTAAFADGAYPNATGAALPQNFLRAPSDPVLPYAAGTVHFRHDGAAQVAYADGHVHTARAALFPYPLFPAFAALSTDDSAYGPDMAPPAGSRPRPAPDSHPKKENPMTKHAFLLLALLSVAAPAARAQDFATHATGSGLSGNPSFSDPNAALGKPTTLFNDPYSDNATFHRSLVASSDGPAPDGLPTLVSLGGSGAGTLTVQFDTPITHDPAHWYGDDFLVFGNQAFNGDDDGSFVAPDTDMDTYHVSSVGNTYSQLPTVSVSANGTDWYTYPASSGTMTGSDGQIVTDGYGGTSYFYPENAYAWNSAAHDWGTELDFMKPVNPALTNTDFAGKTVAQAIGLYNGSAGGVSFSLAGTGLDSISYVRFTGKGSIDGVSRVGLAAAPEPSAGVVLLLGAAGLLFLRRRAIMSTHVGV